MLSDLDDDDYKERLTGVCRNCFFSIDFKQRLDVYDSKKIIYDYDVESPLCDICKKEVTYIRVKYDRNKLEDMIFVGKILESKRIGWGYTWRITMTIFMLVMLSNML